MKSKIIPYYLLDKSINNMQNNILFKAIKIPKLNYVSIILIKNIINLLIYLFITLVFYKSFMKEFNSFISFISCAIIVMTIAGPCFTKPKELMEKYNGYYWNSQANGINYLKVLVDTNLYSTFIRSLSIYIISVIVLLICNIYVLLLSVCINLIIYSIYIIKFYRVFKIKKFKKITRIFKNLVSSLSLLSIGYIVMRLIFLLMSISRNTMLAFGVSTKYVEASNATFNNLIMDIFTKFLGIFNTNINTYKIVILILFTILAVLGLIAVITLKKNKDAILISENQYSSYITQIKSKAKNECLNKYVFKDSIILKNSPINYMHSDFNVIIPPELFLLLGANLSALQTINNDFIILSILAVELYVVLTSVLRNLVSHFIEVWEYKEDIKHIPLLKLLSNKNINKELFTAKVKILRNAALLPEFLVIIIIILPILFKIDTNNYIYLIFLIIAVVIFIIFLPLWILKPYHDCFAILLHTYCNNNEIEKLISINNYKGFSIVKKADDLIVSMIIYFTILCFVFLGFFPLLKGTSWLYVYIILLIILPIALIISVINNIKKEKKV